MTSPVPVPAELAERIEAQREEYGTYVAADDIYVGTALAYTARTPVPVSNVKAHGYLDAGLVVKVGTKAYHALMGTEAPSTADAQAEAAVASAEAGATADTSSTSTSTSRRRASS